jgi:hypothetical protein
MLCERMWLATRLPLCRISTVVSVMRASMVSRMSRDLMDDELDDTMRILISI